MINYIKSQARHYLTTDNITIFLIALSLLTFLGLKVNSILTYASLPYLLLLLPSALILQHKSEFSFFRTLSPIALRICSGLLSGAIVVAFLISVRGIVVMEWLSISGLLSLEIGPIITLVVSLIAMHGLHILLYSYQKRILASALIHERLLFYICSTLLVTAFMGADLRSTSVIAISFLIYSLLIDLFIDQKKANLIWLVVWTIILGSFLSIYIVFVYNNYVSIPSKPLELLSAFTVFSIIFVLCGFLYSVYGILNNKNNLLPAEWEFNYGNSLHLRSRIQLSILLTLIFSFITIGIVSVHQFNLQPGTHGYDLTAKFTQALLSTYVFLFLIGFAISFSLSQYIRNPLLALGKTLKEVKLNKNNKKISWQGSDEIGYLIQEYNSMIEQLETNASQLAEIERDNAWREMAKQVAHEIKNPLTPMKLSLQHLQMTLGDSKEDERTVRMCGTLMHQIENLQQIADEFANFGSLPKTDNKKVLLNDIVETIHDLFRNRQDMDIHLIEPIDDIGVYADKNQLVRVLNNIVKNSIQAIPEDRKGHIELMLYKQENKAIISVRDNGVGIARSEQDHIFKPRFTTKSNGSGLGLAISANMLDSMGGRIHFNSIPDEGTEFFVELPLIRSKARKEVSRVSLYD
ncbi:MAG: signal transduction histidine kinase [Saprospiraceae bacterium]|jgi:signal transduction histidine kinase